MKGAASFAKTKKKKKKAVFKYSYTLAQERRACAVQNKSMLMWTVVIRLRGSGKSLVSLTDHQVAA